MQNFRLHTPTQIIFGEGQVDALKDLLPHGTRILITIGGGSVKQNGVLDQVMTALKDHEVDLFEGIEPNPKYETLMQAVEQVRQQHYDLLLSVGGGSVLDGTKFIAAAAHYDPSEDPWRFVEAGGLGIKQAMPIGCVLTLPATGSESNANSVISRLSTGQKLGFASAKVIPQFAILDPTHTYTLPTRQVANGVVDAFVHTIEQYLTYPVNARLQDRFAEGILQTLVEEGPRALAEPHNYEVRANIMWSATMALNGLIGAGVPQDWATHMLGHELTAVYGLDHAQTLAVVLPSLLQVQRTQKHAKLLQYAERVWGLDCSDPEHAIERAIEKTRAFFESMGTPTTLAGYDISNPDLDLLVKRLETHNLTQLGEHQDIDLAKSRLIYQMAS